MSDNTRMLNSAIEPHESQVYDWIGSENVYLWTKLTDFIEARYPGVFETKWWFGGKNWGWSLRYKKSKSFCNLIPEQGQFKILLVFGANERQKVETILPELVSHVRADYLNADTFRDGRWVLVVVDDEEVLADVERLLTLKRKPNAMN
jgi:hypothetical protein